MDLSERTASSTRHPWEVARARAVESILREGGESLGSVLDYGCGDGYMGRHLVSALGGSSYTGFDSELSDEQCRAWSSAEHTVFTNRLPPLAEFDTVLACDVIEHVPDDQTLLSAARERLKPGGRMLVTVPAFQSLFSKHDRALRHFRRYSLQELGTSLERAKFSVLHSGYLFGSLLVPRLLSSALERSRTPSSPEGAQTAADLGIGAWTGGPALSQALTGLLELDNRSMLRLAKLGVKLPGLSAWALVKADGAA